MSVLKRKSLVLFLFLYVNFVYSAPTVYYANVGETVSLPCNVGGGQMACYSSYTLRDTVHSMVPLSASRKYQFQGSRLMIQNVQPTDAGFYSCSTNCNQMKSDTISLYLQPMQMGQPIMNTQWIPIPPLPTDTNVFTNNMLYAVVSDERLDAAAMAGSLSPGEIAALVIGLVIAFFITCAIVAFLCVLHNKRKAQKREKNCNYLKILSYSRVC
jgi:hypothetical protein